MNWHLGHDKVVSGRWDANYGLSSAKQTKEEEKRKINLRKILNGMGNKSIIP